MTVEINPSEIAQRVIQDLPPELYLPIYRQAERMAKVCESPIEVMLAVAIDVLNHLRWLQFGDGHHVAYVSNGTESKMPPSVIHIVPQATFEKKYRVDFVGMIGQEMVAIECDGHDFHERTKEQAERDRSRDRELQRLGIPILRFTGREINRSPTDCARQVVNFLVDLHNRNNPERLIA